MSARRLLALLLLALSGCASLAPSITHRKSGATTTLEGLRGKVVVLNFWAEWCHPCVVEMPNLAAVVSEAGPDVLFLPIYYQAGDLRGRTADWLQAQPDYFRDQVCFANRPLLTRYELKAIPATYVLGRDGTTVASFVGSLEGKRLDELRAAIARALK